MPRRRDRGGDRNLELGEHHVAAGEHRAGTLVVQREPPIGARGDHDGVLGVGVDDHDRGAAGPGDLDGPVQPDPVGLQVRPQLPGGRVVADRADELHPRARPRRRHRLVAPLPPGACRNDDASTVSPGRGSVDGQRQIEVHTAHHTDVCHGRRG